MIEDFDEAERPEDEGDEQTDPRAETKTGHALIRVYHSVRDRHLVFASRVRYLVPETNKPVSISFLGLLTFISCG